MPIQHNGSTVYITFDSSGDLLPWIGFDAKTKEYDAVMLLTNIDTDKPEEIPVILRFGDVPSLNKLLYALNELKDKMEKGVKGE